MKRLLCIACLLMPSLAMAAVDVETTRVGHGVRAWYATNSNVPVVHVILSFEGAGSVSDPAGKAGRAALAAAMLTEGAGSYDAQHFQRALDEKAIEISADSSQDRLTIHIHALRDQAAAAGQLLALALSQPRFDAPDLARVKTQTVSLLARLQESPGYLASRRFEETAFAGHPYASPVYGTPASIAGIDAADLRSYMGTYVARNNLLVTAAGDVDSSLLDTMLEPVMAALPDSEAGSVPISKITMQGSGSALTVPVEVPQSVVLFAAPGVARSDPRFYSYYLLNEIIGGNGLTSRLADGVRQKKGLVYSVGTGIDERSGSSVLMGNMATRTDSAAEAISTVKTILGDFAARGATNQECEDARTHVLGSLPLQLDSSRAVASTLLMMRIFHLGEHYLEERAAKFKAVRCADINAVAKDVLAADKFLFITAGKP